MSPRATKLAAAVAAAAALVAAALGWLLTRPGDDAAAPHDLAPAATSAERAVLEAPETSPAAPSADPVQVSPAVTHAPDDYARSVAALVFGLDTRTGSREDYRSALLADADPALSAGGRDDLERTLDLRIPTADAWARMAANEQWSQWQPTDVHEPGTWQQIVTLGQAEPGWAMRNVTGIETTHYRDAGRWREASRERTVTVGMRCPLPESGVELDRCRLVLVPPRVVP